MLQEIIAILRKREGYIVATYFQAACLICIQKDVFCPLDKINVLRITDNHITYAAKLRVLA